MPAQETTALPLGSAMPLRVVADLQGHLMPASHGLHRLPGQACNSLRGHFQGAAGALRLLAENPTGRTPREQPRFKARFKARLGNAGTPG